MADNCLNTKLFTQRKLCYLHNLLQAPRKIIFLWFHTESFMVLYLDIVSGWGQINSTVKSSVAIEVPCPIICCKYHNAHFRLWFYTEFSRFSTCILVSVQVPIIPIVKNIVDKGIPCHSDHLFYISEWWQNKDIGNCVSNYRTSCSN